MTDTVTLDLNHEGAKLKMGVVFGKRDHPDLALRHYTELDFQREEINQLCVETRELLRKSNQGGTPLRELEKTGQLLYDELLTVEVKDTLRQRKASFLIFSMDESLVPIPWELLFDGENFLCLKYGTARNVRTKQKPRTSFQTSRRMGFPLKMLVLANPTGDLHAAYQEGLDIRDALEHSSDKIKVNLHTTKVDLRFVKKEIRDYDIVHFAGHADYESDNPSRSGWIFKDGNLTSQQVVQLGASLPLPSLVFSNACQSGQTEAWDTREDFENRIYGLANAFLLAGVTHYI